MDHSSNLPSKEALLAFIKGEDGKVDKRKIAKAFKLKGDDRKALRNLLKEMGLASSKQNQAKTRRGEGKMPPVFIIEVTGVNNDGEAYGKPAKWEDTRKEPPHVLITDSGKGTSPSIGQLALVKAKETSSHQYEASVIRILPQQAIEKVLGVYVPTKRGGMLEPVNRKQRNSYFIPKEDAKGAQAGELVLATPRPRGKGKQLGPQEAVVLERLGDSEAPKSFSLIAIHHQDIPTEFTNAALEQAENSEDPVMEEGRIDLREIPLVTIDGADARDFDDAVWAEKTDEGWHLLVAIADVAHYVKPDDALDQEALKRGNSTYFPDRVVPMLPEALSNGLCSLNPHVDRYCLAVHMWIDEEGNLQSYEFVRGIMQSHARLTYEQAQKKFDTKDEKLADILNPLYGAYAALTARRNERGALDLDLPEYQIVLGKDGHVDEVTNRLRLDSHKLIEEFMVTANVAAGNAIESDQLAGIFRIHESPSADKVEDLKQFLQTLDYSLPSSPTAHHFNRILRKAHGQPEQVLISSSVLRSQMQAYYSPANVGHFGLGLEEYAHFTSPIRRYADLVVHRSIISMLEGTTADMPNRDQLNSIGDHISTTERNSMVAEREANDRYITAYMAEHQEAEFSGHVTSVGSYGLFVTLADTGASGLVRMSDLGDDYYIFEEKIHSLIGRRKGHRYQLGQRVVVSVAEADTQLGSLRFSMVSSEKLEPIDFKPARKNDRRDNKGGGYKKRDSKGDRPYKGKPKAKGDFKGKSSSGKPNVKPKGGNKKR